MPKVDNSLKNSAYLSMRLIGPMRMANASGSSVNLRGRKSRAVLAFLALSPGAVPRETLAQHLWSSKHSDQGRSSLRQCVYEIQDALGSGSDTIIESERYYLKIKTLSVETDVQKIYKTSVDKPEALSLITGDLLEDLYGLDPKFDVWLQTERRRILEHTKAVASGTLNRSTDPSKVIIAATYMLKHVAETSDVCRKLIEAHNKLGSPETAEATKKQYNHILSSSCANDIQSSSSRLDLKSIEKDRLVSEKESDVSLGYESVYLSKLTKIGVSRIISLDSKSQRVARGLTEELLHALSRFRELRCLFATDLGNNTTFLEYFRSLGVDYVIEGTVQSGATLTRVTAHLVDLSNHSEIIWSQKFDYKIEDALLLQTDAASQIVAQIDPSIIARKGEQIEHKPYYELTPVELVLRALPAISRLERSSFLRAGDMLSLAVKHDSCNGAAHAWLAYWHLLLLGQGWASNPADAENATWELAKRAITLDPRDSRALALAGHVQAFTHRRLDEALTLHERALSINPNLPIAWLFYGLAHTYAGRHEEAIRHIRNAKRLSPFDPHEFFFDMGLTLSLSLSGDDKAAVECGRSAADINPMFSSTFKSYLSALGYAGDPSTTSGVLRHLLQLEPGFTVSTASKRSPLTACLSGLTLERSGLALG